MVKTVFCVCGSSPYLYHLPGLLESIASLNIKSSVYFCLVNGSVYDIHFCNKIIKKFFCFEDFILEKKFVEFKSLDDVKGYCTNMRAFMLNEICSHDYHQIVYVDINTLFLAEFSETLNQSLLYDASIILDPNHKSLHLCEEKLGKAYQLASSRRHSSFVGPLGTILKGCSLAGLQIYTNSSLVKNYFREYVELVSCAPHEWYADQEALAILYLKYRKSLSYQLFHEDYVCMSSSYPVGLFAIYKKGGRNLLYDEYSFFNSPFYSLPSSFPSRDLFSFNPIEKASLSLLQRLINKLICCIWFNT